MQDYKPEQNQPSQSSSYPYAPTPGFQPDPNQQQNLYQEAQRRVKVRMAFYRSLASYIVICAFLILIWVMTSGPGSYFWPGWAMGALGIALAFQGAAYFFSRGASREQMIQDELRRMGH